MGEAVLIMTHFVYTGFRYTVSRLENLIIHS